MDVNGQVQEAGPTCVARWSQASEAWEGPWAAGEAVLWTSGPRTAALQWHPDPGPKPARSPETRLCLQPHSHS